MAPRQGWRSSLVATIVLVVLGVAFVAGTAAVALLAKSMPALTIGRGPMRRRRVDDINECVDGAGIQATHPDIRYQWATPCPRGG